MNQTSNPRFTDVNSANNESLALLWANGQDILNQDIDLRFATIVLGFIMFISIYSILVIFHGYGGSKR